MLNILVFYLQVLVGYFCILPAGDGYSLPARAGYFELYLLVLDTIVLYLLLLDIIVFYLLVLDICFFTCWCWIF